MAEGAGEPHAMVTVVVATGAVQCIDVPLSLPAQVQLQGPLPCTVGNEPSIHNPVVGALVKVCPEVEAGPHWPGTQAGGGSPE